MRTNLFVRIVFGLILVAGQPRTILAADPAGHWEGAITLPGTPLAIRVDLGSAAAVWSGTIDIPAQGLRGFKLGGVTVAGADVCFTMPGIPGEPKFAGKIDAAGQGLGGDFMQSGQTFPFKLERKKAVAMAGETPAQGIPGKGLAGEWQGTLQASPVLALRLLLEITNAPGDPLAGSLVSIDQGDARMPLTALTEKESAVHFEAASVHGDFNGKMSGDGSEISGTWKQATVELPLTIKRLAKKPNLAKPQDPKKPYSYNEEHVVIEHDGIKLAGTLTLPRGPGRHRAVVLISGSGPNDRDEAILGHRPFLVLADRLTRDGVVVLRCDKRGCAASTGDYKLATDADYVTDTLAEVAWLKARPEVDPARLGLVGHSEGGIVAPLAAVKSADVKYIVLLAGVGRPMEELLEQQAQDINRTMGAGEEVITGNLDAQRKMFQVLKEDGSPAAAEKLRQIYHEQISRLTEEQRKMSGVSDRAFDGQVAMMLTPWFRSLLAYDPRPALEAVKCPTLALNGEMDVQVACQTNLDSIRADLVAGGNTNVTTIALPGLNHLFQTCQTGAVSEYAEIQETMSPKVLSLVSDWIARQ